MGILNIRSLLLAAIVICNCITWTSSRHHYTHNVNGHRSRHRRQGAGLFLSASYVLPGGEGSGAWTEWGAVSPCSRTCGGGVASQKRICLEIGPDGRPHCTGGDTKFFSCQTQDCPEGSGDFRAEQCAAFNDKLFRNNRYNWVPYTKAMNPCELNCMPVGERFYYRQKDKVIDGTRCNDETFDVCVDGTCQPVGCDMMLGSNAREDKCRQCRGNGSNCHTISGVIDRQDLKKGYTDILLIPEGATNIVIGEVKDSDNYLALRGRENNRYYLNGDYHIDFPRTLMIAGSLWHYERSQQGFAAPDKLRCLGPTNESLYLSLLLQSENVGVEYEYSVPSALAPPPNQQYQWAHGEFSECSEPCGGGYQTRQVSCRTRDDLELVKDELCDSNFKPATNQSCNTQPCGPRWVEDPWGPCSKPCGEGGTRSRQVYCQKIIANRETFRFPTMVADKECFDVLGPKPELYQQCNQNETCPTWFTGPWKPCDKLCGEGKQRRQVVCHQKINGRVTVHEDSECSDEKPATEQPCTLHPCEGLDWVVSDWSGCDTCLSTVRTRTAWCVTKANELVNSSLCAYHPEPVLKEECDKTKLPACDVQWYATQWSPCSSNCGKGVKTRKVFCGLFDGSSVLKVDDNRCDSLLKYNDTVECEEPKEKCPAKWFAGPWSECTKKCGGGEQFRHVVCMSGGKESLNCEADTILFKSQPCNIGPCDMDEMLPVDSKSTTIIDEEDYDDCVEGEDEDYEEVGAEVISKQTTSFKDIMLSDGPSTIEGSGISETFDITLTTETRYGSSETDITLSTEGSGEDWSTLIMAETTESSESTLTDSSTEPSGTNKTTDSSGPTKPDSSTENAKSTKDISTVTIKSSGSTTADSSTEPSGTNKTTDSSGPTKPDSSTENAKSTKYISTVTIKSSGSTTADSSTEPSGTNKTTDSSGPTKPDSSTENAKPTKDISTVTIKSSGSTTADSSTKPSETNKTTDSSEPTKPDSSTENAKSTKDISTVTIKSSGSTTADSSTEPSGTNKTTDSSGPTKPDSSTENAKSTKYISTVTIKSSGSTTADSSTEPSGTNKTTDSSGPTKPDSSTENAKSTKYISTVPIKSSGSTTADSSTEPSGTNKTTDSSGPTKPDSSTENAKSTKDISTVTIKSSGSTAADSSMKPSETNRTTDSSEPTKPDSSTENAKSTKNISTVTIKSSGSTIADSNTEPSGSTQDVTTDVTESTLIYSNTEPSGTNKTTYSSGPTKPDSSTENAKSTKYISTVTIKSSGSTTADSSTEPSGTNKTTDSSGPTKPDSSTENAKSTKDISTVTIKSSGSTIADSNTEPSGSTQDVTTDVTESTLIYSSTEPSGTNKTTDSSGPTKPDSSTENAKSTKDISTVTIKSSGSTTADSSTEPSGTNKTTDSSRPTKPDSSTENAKSTKDISTVTIKFSGSTTADSSTKPSETNKTTDSSEPTKPDSSTENAKSTKDISTVTIKSSGSTTADSSTEPSGTNKTTDSSGPTKPDSSTENAKSTKYISTVTIKSSGSTTADSSTEPSGTNKTTDSSGPTKPDSSTENAKSTKYISTVTIKSSGSTTADSSTEPSGTNKTTDSSGTTKPDSSTENAKSTKDISTVTIKSSGSTTADSSTKPSETNKTTDSSGPTKPNSSTENANSTKDISTVTIKSSGSTTADSSTEPSVTNKTTDSSGPTKPDSSTENAKSTKDISTVTIKSSGSTIADSNTEPSGSTQDVTTDVTESTLIYSSTEPSGTTTENISEGSTTTEETELTTEGTTPWDWETTFIAPRRCKPRKIAKCIKSKFGCCPDKRTPAAGPFDAGCPNPKTCKESKFGCCPDGVSPANGPRNKDCPVTPCNETLFGCCTSDNVTAAEGNDQEGCPPPPPACQSSEFGCCDDDKTQAQDLHGKGCPETETTQNTATTTAKTPSATELERDCAKSTFGCCYDNETDASGPNGEGCPCSISQFGCCPDGVSTAVGPDMEGCVMSCNTSAYGCCSDGETPAHGPELQGCCLLSAYGCCPDNYKPAEGPNLEGCGCQYAHFGCCPDNVTIARGPGNEGCGCKYTQFGCCPDRHTEAMGPDMEGCGCQTYQFGCCADGETRATGPDQQGCRCEQSKYGCCGDGVTAALGPDRIGCDCSNSKYGCCPDGVTEAQGKKFLNCTDKLENRQAACALAYDKGSCRNYTVYWYYDREYGGCSRFWYSGCEGNDNRFSSQEECEDICVRPPPKDACNLPMVKGACAGYNVHWYYDAAREQCSQFVYGGCLGNNNKFDSRELCQKQCEPEKTEDQCNLPIERGPCAGNYLRWGYDADSKSCIEFVWGGCAGNNNRFSTKAACLLRCNPPGVPEDKCKLAQDAGTCTEKIPTWSFNQTENQCVPFYYTGCGGNDNRFLSEQECTRSCPSYFVQDVCTLPAVTGNCAEYTLRWFYDTTKETCRQFYYGGCGGNDNNFQSMSECENRCMEQQITTTTVQPLPPPNPYTTEYCYMEADPGPCTLYETRWAYDEHRSICYEFKYGGCGGNQNNFPSLEYCQHYCHAIKDVCQLPMVTGPCGEEHQRWFYDAENDRCSQFVYGGCEGNDNRFNTRDECEARCRSGAGHNAPPTTVVYTTTISASEAVSAECRTSASLEQCVRGGRVWYYAAEQRMCVSHDNAEYGAYCRHTGVFPTEEACERTCGAFRDLEVCRYNLDAGTCNSAIPKFYFNQESKSCEQFTYGGCHGGPNRFSTLDECEQICKPVTDPCAQAMEPGNCLQNIMQWFYDQARDDCQQFFYTGCSGNDNRFGTRDECLGRCKKSPPVLTTTVSSVNPSYEAECQMPESLVPCGDNVTIYYYNPAELKCVEGNFGSCRHPNSYRTEEECERRCGAFKGFDVCESRLDPGPCKDSIRKVYWNAAAGRCEVFAYGGCLGGPNRFSSEDECEEVCGGSGPEPECLLPVDSGRACAAQRRWYYSAAHADCLPFVYSGCAGNDNNFHSYGECALRCKISNGEPEAPSADPATEQRVSGVVGQPATLRCLFHGNPPPRITWRRGEITIDGDTGRYRLLSDGALEIVSLYRNDSGVYICIGENELGRAAQEIRLEVNDESANEVTPPDCRAYVAECAALQCEFGVQTRPAGGCERCECVRRAVDCDSLRAECDRLQCAYGTDRTVDDDGCERCRCIDPPCVNKACAADERCVTNVYTDPINNKRRYYAECRIANKTGYCPREDGRAADSQCHRQCNDDADCVGVGKCCVRGCSQLCLEPVDTTPTSLPARFNPDEPQAPLANVKETEPEVTATEGGKASLRCLFHGNPPPKISWRRGEITIDGNADRYRLLSDGTLEIVSLYRNDTGVYICIAENDLGRAMQEIRLEVNDPVDSPAGIAGVESAVMVGDIGKPITIRCLAYGFPKPSIFWYRGQNGSMVPYSSALYEARENTLLIRRLTDETLGEYICQAYNGIGKPAEWAFAVQSAAPGGRETTRPAPGGRETTRPAPRPAPQFAPPPTTPQVPVYTVPVTTSISAATTRLSAGAEINLPCAVDGYPVPEVHWTKDGVTVTTNDRMLVTDARLTVAHATTNDSGTYGCHAANAYSSHHSLVQITVEGLYIPPTCKDNPYFANCHLIVKSKYCHHKYYSSFCCKSCVEAGLLDPSQLEMQADEPWWNRK